MKHNLRRALPILIVALLFASAITFWAVQTDVPARVNYYTQTGHLVREPFLSYFIEHGEIATFGYPLTDAYQTEDDMLVQTFQRAQLRLSVRGVELAPIGEALQLGEPGSATVDPIFQSYYELHGSGGFFGLPLGPARTERGVFVQDFERARLVRDERGNIHMANLGSIYLSVNPPLEESGQANLRVGTPTPPADLRPSLSVAKPTVGQGDAQTLYLYIEDENGQPVEGAQALAILRYDGRSAEVTLPPTDERGLARTSFVVPPASPGSRVVVEAHVLIGETFLTIETIYTQWW